MDLSGLGESTREFYKGIYLLDENENIRKIIY